MARRQAKCKGQGWQGGRGRGGGGRFPLTPRVGRELHNRNHQSPPPPFSLHSLLLQEEEEEFLSSLPPLTTDHIREETYWEDKAGKFVGNDESSLLLKVSSCLKAQDGVPSPSSSSSSSHAGRQHYRCMEVQVVVAVVAACKKQCSSMQKQRKRGPTEGHIGVCSFLWRWR